MKKIAFLVFIALLVSCGKDGSGKSSPVKSVTISKSVLMLGMDVRFKLSAATVPDKASAELEWRSDDAVIADVSADGTVTAIQEGETVIRVSCEGKEDTCKLVVCASPVAVDLGLRGIKWASFNIGASDPSQAGKLFYWGATIPIGLDPNIFTPYIKNVAPNGPPVYKVSKYCQNADYGLDGYTDLLNTLQVEDDAATQVLGAGWRMPTQNEFNQLISDCDWSWDAGRNSFKIANKNNSSNYIYLPITGHPNSLFDQEKGYFWTSNVSQEDPTGVWRYEVKHVNSNVVLDLHTTVLVARTATNFIRAVKVD